jgi:hypothetical protein
MIYEIAREFYEPYHRAMDQLYVSLVAVNRVEISLQWLFVQYYLVRYSIQQLLNDFRMRHAM